MLLIWATFARPAPRAEPTQHPSTPEARHASHLFRRRPPSPPRVKRLVIDKVPGSFPAPAFLYTFGPAQYVCYYDAAHWLTVAKRTLPAMSTRWIYARLPTQIAWDSHNSITLAVDRNGHVHLSGNMHCVMLIYFRSREPGNISTFERLPMTGKEESVVSYPNFMKGRDGALLFNYRHGHPGRGIIVVNRYHSRTRTWSRMMARPLLDGEGRRSAYNSQPRRGPDGRFHMVWLWRDRASCDTNHDLSYARSPDLVHWETATGESVSLPLRLSNRSLVVDPVPTRSGLINGGTPLSFDTYGRPVIAYHKHDANRSMQIYVARLEEGIWVRRQLTGWDQEVLFRGVGSMGFVGIAISKLTRVAPGVLALSYRHKHYGSGRITLDERTLAPLPNDRVSFPCLPRELDTIRSDFVGANHAAYKGMSKRWTVDRGEPNPAARVQYVLQHETLGTNKDKQPAKLAPDSELELLELRGVPVQFDGEAEFAVWGLPESERIDNCTVCGSCDAATHTHGVVRGEAEGGRGGGRRGGVLALGSKRR